MSELSRLAAVLEGREVDLYFESVPKNNLWYGWMKVWTSREDYESFTSSGHLLDNVVAGLRSQAEEWLKSLPQDVA